MAEPFRRIFRVRWSEVNAHGQVSLAAYLHYLIETAWDWGAAGGLSKAESEALGLAWVVRETELTIKRPLRPEEIFDFSIWLREWRRVRGTRCFELRLKDSGDIVAYGAQEVVTLDGRTLLPVRPADHLLEPFLIENPPDMAQQKFPKFQIEPEKAFTSRREVEWRDLDWQGHANNATYVDYAEEAVAGVLAGLGWPPSRFQDEGLLVVTRRLHIQYLQTAVWGDDLLVAASLGALAAGGGRWLVEVIRPSTGARIMQCVLDWVLVERAGGQEVTLPQSLVAALQERVQVL